MSDLISRDIFESVARAHGIEGPAFIDTLHRDVNALARIEQAGLERECERLKAREVVLSDRQTFLHIALAEAGFPDHEGTDETYRSFSLSERVEQMAAALAESKAVVCERESRLANIKFLLEPIYGSTNYAPIGGVLDRVLNICDRDEPENPHPDQAANDALRG